ncbi:YdgA family protein [Serratia sp. DD3]|uniref:YdgA family protein n=1 Tax=Serratia sp. DD3 TaxID=1410619 RepID=UPI0003C4E349|nr:YdgA family protein [Serratia sp. DD3]KEY58035.1 hypothetical protein SRDD_31600 [Serratia sp. DD3]
MKKSVVAVSIIVVLGAAWTGASWYTGKLIEQRMGEVVANANNQLNDYLPKAGLKLSAENYQRGIFSSRMRYVLRTNSTSDNAFLKPGDEIAFIETIDHGPFPLSQLKRFHLLPSMASVYTELENTAKVKPLFEITKGKSLFSANSRVSYSGAINTVADVIPLEFTKDKVLLKFSGAQINADMGRDMQTLKLDANSDNLTISGPSALGQNEQVTIQGVTLNVDTHLGQSGMTLGNQNMGVKQFAVAVDGKTLMSVEGFNLGSKFDEQGSNLAGQLSYTLDGVKVQDMDFGSAKLLLKVDNLDAKALKEFSEQYNQQAMALLKDSQEIDPVAYQEEARTILLKNLPLLLKGNPSIAIAPLSWKNSQGESSFNLNVAFQDQAQFATPTEDPEQKFARTFKKIEANLSIPMAMAIETTTQAAKLQGYSAEDAQKFAQQQVQTLSAMGQMFKLTTEKDGVISSSFNYADNQIELNGNKMSLQDLSRQLGAFGGNDGLE